MSFDDPYPYRLFLTLLENLPEGFRVATVETNQVVGYCVLSPSNVRNTLMISSIAVHPSFRNQGIGTILLEDSIRIIKELNTTMSIGKIVLQVAEVNNSARSLYEKFGFRYTRTLRDYYGKGKNGIQMELLL